MYVCMCVFAFSLHSLFVDQIFQLNSSTFSLSFLAWKNKTYNEEEIRLCVCSPLHLHLFCFCCCLLLHDCYQTIKCNNNNKATNIQNNSHYLSVLARACSKQSKQTTKNKKRVSFILFCLLSCWLVWSFWFHFIAISSRLLSESPSLIVSRRSLLLAKHFHKAFATQHDYVGSLYKSTIPK